MSGIRERYSWKKVEAPKTWCPKHNGEELAGFYGGRTTRTGRFGQYEVLLVHVPGRGSFMISGVRIIQLADASCAEPGDPVRVIYLGLNMIESADGEARNMKLFDLYVSDGERLAPEDMPQVKQ